MQTKENTMSNNQKKYGAAMLVFVIAVFALFAAVLIIPATRAVFEKLSATHPYIMGFIKFAEKKIVHLIEY